MPRPCPSCCAGGEPTDCYCDTSMTGLTVTISGDGIFDDYCVASVPLVRKELNLYRPGPGGRYAINVRVGYWVAEFCGEVFDAPGWWFNAAFILSCSPGIEGNSYAGLWLVGDVNGIADPEGPSGCGACVWDPGDGLDGAPRNAYIEEIRPSTGLLVAVTPTNEFTPNELGTGLVISCDPDPLLVRWTKEGSFGNIYWELTAS